MFTRAQQQEVEEDFYSKQDATRERYARELQDIDREALIEKEWHDYMEQVHAAGYTNTDDYEQYWTRTLKYYEQYYSHD